MSRPLRSLRPLRQIPGAVAVLLLPVACFAADFELPITTAQPRIDFSAGHMEYNESSHTVLLTGDAVITDSTFTLKSDRIQADLDRQVFETPSPLELSDGGTGFKARSGRFDFADREGRFSGLSGAAAPWIFNARDASVARGGYKLRGATVTSCDFVPPHYHFTATRVSLLPNVHLIAWNTVFFLGRVPVFYLPFFYQSLKPNPFIITKINVGYDQRNGVEVQTDNRIRLSPLYTERVYLDYFSRQNPGLGNEIDYRRSDGSRGTLYGYWIRDRSLALDRWTVLGDVWQRLGPRYFLQGRLETASDPDFNNAYFRSHQIRVAAELNNSAALVRQTHFTTTRLSVARHDSRDPLDPLGFKRATQSLPRVDFSAAPFSVLGIPVLNNGSLFADHAIDTSRDFYQDSAGGTWSVTQNVKLARNIVFVPAVGISELYQDKTPLPGSTTTYAFDQYTGSYFTQADLRMHTFAGDTTAGHRYARRFAPNTLQDDLTAADRGEQLNLLTGEHVYMPTFTTRFAASSGYDLQRSTRGATERRGFHDRLQPVVGEATWLPLPLLAFLAREQYRFGIGHQSILLAVDYGLPDQNRAGLSLSQNAADNGHVFAGTTFGWYPQRSSWTVEGALRYDLHGVGGGSEYRLDHAVLFEKELSVRKVWHDFNTRFTFRQRPGGVLEYTARVEFRFGKGAESKKPDLQQEFYPWRQGLQEK